MLEIKAAYIITTSKLWKPKFEKLIEECSGIATGLERVSVCVHDRERERGIDLFLTPRRAQCTARAAAEAGAMAAAGAA